MANDSVLQVGNLHLIPTNLVKLGVNQDFINGKLLNADQLMLVL